MARKKLRVIPLGGLGEIGKNMMLLEYGDSIIAVDAGLMFPEEEMLGIDLVIPDLSYVLDGRRNLRAIFLTHGHEDHIGALPYILHQVNVPVYCTRLTAGLVEVRLKEAKLLKQSDIRVVKPGDRIQEGPFQVEPFSVAHSVPDSTGLAIHTPVGLVIHTGDFKLDHTPVMAQSTDLRRLAQHGHEGVLLLLADSTYAEIPGYTPSEQVVGEALHSIMSTSPGRVIVTTFASLIARVQQVIDAADDTGRRVFVTGRSMQDNVQMATQLGYLNVPKGMMVAVRELDQIPHDRLAIITTGSQGEPTSALTRIANQEHPHVTIVPGDTVVLSASAVPGNESLVYRTVDNLFRLGARVLYNRIANVHVRGHAAQEELKIVHSLVRPRYFVPIHGEYRHMALHADLARSLGMPDEHIFVLTDGDVLELDEQGAHVSGRVHADYVYVDGLGVGDIDHLVLRDRRHLATDGMVVIILAIEKQTGRLVGLPEVVSRGFVDIEESEELLQRTRQKVVSALEGADHIVEWGVVNTKVKDAIAQFLYQETHRRPMVLPVSVEV
ncbi:MAG: ribonuclease J [Chloroflexi bacterium RBG_16_68_14]|nr:MAG: ribonuclease J [Chloroflexi bacterium RBG_16_68_14]